MRNLALILPIQPKLLVFRRVEMMMSVDQHAFSRGGQLRGQDGRGPHCDRTAHKSATR
jgi:hypothetical protein